MRLNTIKPAEGAKRTRKRLGRGPGSGSGKTSGKGHKGQHARAGGYHKVGFEGGQMPKQRRLPKVGFRSRKSLHRQEIRLSDFRKLEGNEVSAESLLKAGITSVHIKYLKIILSGEVTSAYTIKGIPVTKGARAAIEAAGGKVEEVA